MNKIPVENTPRISVIMSVYKEPLEWLRQSISSILQQTYTDFEFIIICDNPNYKEGISLLYEYATQDNRIRLLFNEENIGLTKSLNKGLAIAKGKYIARMDADDISLPKRFEKQIKYMNEHQDVIVCGTRISYFGNVSVFDSNKWIKTSNNEIKAYLLINNCFAHPTVFIRKSILDNNNILYDENFKQAQDYRMWETLKDLGNYANIAEPLLKYRVSSSQVSSKHSVNSNNYAHIIRRRLIAEQLEKCGLSIQLFADSKLSTIKKSIIKSKYLIGKENVISLIKLLYFSNNRKKTKTFLISIINGDFLKFDFYEIIKLLKMTVGYTPALTI